MKSIASLAWPRQHQRQHRQWIRQLRSDAQWYEPWLRYLADRYQTPLAQLEQMTPGQFAREIAIFLADHIRSEARRLGDMPKEYTDRAALREERKRIKASDDWIDQRIYQLFLRNEAAKERD